MPKRCRYCPEPEGCDECSLTGGTSDGRASYALITLHQHQERLRWAWGLWRAEAEKDHRCWIASTFALGGVVLALAVVIGALARLVL